MIKCGNCREPHPTVERVRACYAGTMPARRVDAAMARDRGRDRSVNVPKRRRHVPNGTYTIVHDDGAYTTLQLVDDFRTDGPAHAQVVKLLSGPDNETDFRGCAFLEGEEVRVWRRFRGGTFEPKLKIAIGALLRFDDDRQADAREAYALRSGRCSRCARKLTVPASLHRGLGPECAKILGVA